MMDGIAQAMDTNYFTSHSFLFSQFQVKQIEAITFHDPEFLVMHPRFFDKVADVEKRQIKRYFLHYTGQVSHYELLTLPPDQFWYPIKLLALYYIRYKTFPNPATCSIPLLEAALH